VVHAVLVDLDGILLDRKQSHARFILEQRVRLWTQLWRTPPDKCLAVAVRFNRNGLAARRESFP
jgi:hypothetical protein